MVNVKADELNDGSTACLTGAGQINPTGRWPESNSLIGGTTAAHLSEWLLKRRIRTQPLKDHHDSYSNH